MKPLLLLECTNTSVPFCLFSVPRIYVFAEFGHLELDRINGTMNFIKGGRRIELENSAVIRRIMKSCS